MPTSNKLKITDLEFDTIKDNLITFLTLLCRKLCKKTSHLIVSAPQEDAP